MPVTAIAGRVSEDLAILKEAQAETVTAPDRPHSALKFTVNGVSLHTHIAGVSNKAVLCLCGALGSALEDFGPQLMGLSGDHTVVSFDPRGYGQSYQGPGSHRTYPVNYLERDADDGASLMSQIGFAKYAVMGWGEGAVSAIILAARYPKQVVSLLTLAGQAHISERDMTTARSLHKLYSGRWSGHLQAIYGNDTQPTVSGWLNAWETSFTARGGDLCMSYLNRVSCGSVLILWGSKDPVVSKEHTDYLVANIKGARLHVFEGQKNDPHKKATASFNRIVVECLAEAFAGHGEHSYSRNRAGVSAPSPLSIVSYSSSSPQDGHTTAERQAGSDISYSGGGGGKKAGKIGGKGPGRQASISLLAPEGGAKAMLLEGGSLAAGGGGGGGRRLSVAQVNGENSEQRRRKTFFDLAREMDEEVAQLDQEIITQTGRKSPASELVSKDGHQKHTGSSSSISVSTRPDDSLSQIANLKAQLADLTSKTQPQQQQQSQQRHDFEIAQLKAQVADLTSKTVSQQSQQRSESQKEILNLKGELAKLKSESSLQTTTASQHAFESAEHADDLTAQMTALQSQLSHAQQEKAEYLKRVSGLEGELETTRVKAQRESAGLQSTVSEISLRASTAESDLLELKASHARASDILNSELSKLRQDRDTMATRSREMQEKMAATKAVVQTSESQANALVAQLQSELEDVKGRSESQAAHVKQAYDVEIETLKRSLQEAVSSKEACDEQLKESQNEKSAMQVQLESEKVDLRTQLESNMDELRAQHEDDRRQAADEVLAGLSKEEDLTSLNSLADNAAHTMEMDRLELDSQAAQARSKVKEQQLQSKQRLLEQKLKNEQRRSEGAEAKVKQLSDSVAELTAAAAAAAAASAAVVSDDKEGSAPAQEENLCIIDGMKATHALLEEEAVQLRQKLSAALASSTQAEADFTQASLEAQVKASKEREELLASLSCGDDAMALLRSEVGESELQRLAAEDTAINLTLEKENALAENHRLSTRLADIETALRAEVERTQESLALEQENHRDTRQREHHQKSVASDTAIREQALTDQFQEYRHKSQKSQQSIEKKHADIETRLEKTQSELRAETKAKDESDSAAIALQEQFDADSAVVKQELESAVSQNATLKSDLDQAVSRAIKADAALSRLRMEKKRLSQEDRSANSTPVSSPTLSKPPPAHMVEIIEDARLPCDEDGLISDASKIERHSLFFRRLNDNEVETNSLRDMIISLTDECRLAKQRFDKTNADCNEAQQLVEDQKLYVSEKFGAGSLQEMQTRFRKQPGKWQGKVGQKPGALGAITALFKNDDDDADNAAGDEQVPSGSLEQLLYRIINPLTMWQTTTVLGKDVSDAIVDLRNGSTTVHRKSALIVGAHVKVTVYDGDGKSDVFPGRISLCNDDNTFAVDYDDGDEESKVPAYRLRLLATDTICLSQTPLSDIAVLLVGRWLAHNQSALRLELADCCIGDAGAVSLGEGLSLNIDLAEIDLSLNNISDSGAAALGCALQTNPALRCLDLRKNAGIGEYGASAIAEGLTSPQAPLEQLYLFGSPVGAAPFGKMLTANCILQDLMLVGAGLGPEGVAAIAEGIKTNTSLHSLYLHSNHAGDVGTALLALALHSNCTLETLDLGANGIEDTGGKALGDMLAVNRAIETLGLRNNKIGNDGGERIAVGLRLNRSLEVLAIEGNQLSDEVAGRISMAFS